MSEPALILDFKPDITAERLAAKPRTQWRLSAAAAAILDSRGPFATPAEMAATAKACVLKMTRPRPLAEAISSAGGVRWGELDAGLMLRRLPGVFAAGEMLDWEAPTGGYLLQGCFASGTRSGESALRWALDEQARALQGGGVDR